jgi:hypothetical protein
MDYAKDKLKEAYIKSEGRIFIDEDPKYKDAIQLS